MTRGVGFSDDWRKKCLLYTRIKYTIECKFNVQCTINVHCKNNDAINVQCKINITIQ